MLSCLYRSSKPGAKSVLEINPAACPVELEQLLNVKGTAALRPRGAQLLYERTDDAGAGAFTPPVLIYIKRLPLPGPCHEVVVKRTEVTHFVGRAQREARLQLQMDHPHLLPALASVRGKHHFYLLLPLAEGDLWAEAESLRSHGTGYMEDELREVAVQVLLGLEQLHKASLAHRDIKPANVLRLHDGRVAVADFGCADGATAGFVSAGTTQFQPPECRRKDPAARRMQVLPKGYDQRAQDMWSLGVTLACLWFVELPVVDRGGGGGGATDREGQPHTPRTLGQQQQQQQQHSLQSSPQKPQQGEYGGKDGLREGHRGAGEEGGLSAEERRFEERWQRWRKGGYCVGVEAEAEAEAEVLPGAVGEGEGGGSGGGGGGSGGGGGARWQRWRTAGSNMETEAGALGSVVMMHNGLAMEEVGGSRAGEDGQEEGGGEAEGAAEGRPLAAVGGCSYGRLGPGGGLYGGQLSSKSDTGMGLGVGGRAGDRCSGGGGGGSGGGLGGLGHSSYSWTSCRSQFQEPPQHGHLQEQHQLQQQQQAGVLPTGQRSSAGGPPGSSTGGASSNLPARSSRPSGVGADPSSAAAGPADSTALPTFLAAAGFRSCPTTVGACGLPMSPAFLDLLSGLLRPRYRDRITCAQALEHPWVQSVLTAGGGGGGGGGLQASQREDGGSTAGGRMGVPEPLSAASRGRREAGGVEGQGRGRGRGQQAGMRAVGSASAFGSS